MLYFFIIRYYIMYILMYILLFVRYQRTGYVLMVTVFFMIVKFVVFYQLISKDLLLFMSLL